MSNLILERIEKKIGVQGTSSLLADKLKLSEFNSLLLEVFRKKSETLSPSDIFRYYKNNRFVTPAQIDPVKFLEFTLSLYRAAEQSGVHPLELAPVSPFGACSVLGPVSQNNVISAVRGLEIVADATNLLALEATRRRAECNYDRSIHRLCTQHSHFRGQGIDHPGHTPHFGVFCMVQSGRDPGNYIFELQSLQEHLSFYTNFLNRIGIQGRLKCVFKFLANEPDASNRFEKVTQYIFKEVKGFAFETLDPIGKNENYYRSLHFKIYLNLEVQEFEIGDGGFVNWPVLLTGNQKERMLISGLGTEFLYKVVNGLI